MVTMPNADNFELRSLREYSPHVSGGLIGTGHINFFNAATLRRSLLEAGFSVIEIFTQYTSSLSHVLAHKLGQFRAIPCYDTIMQGGALPLAVNADTLNAVALLNGQFAEWENEVLAGPILGVIART